MHVSTDEELGLAPVQAPSFQKNAFDLRDSKVSPPPPPEGKGLMKDAKMFQSSCLSKDPPIFLDGARWAMPNEGVAIEVYNSDSKVFYSTGEVCHSPLRRCSPSSDWMTRACSALLLPRAS